MTYSIAARDPDTGEMGVAAQSQAFAVGNRRSAAIMVIRATTTGRPWHDMVVNLRVDDSTDPWARWASC